MPGRQPTHDCCCMSALLVIGIGLSPQGKAKFFPGASPHQKTHIIVGEENEENDSGDDDVVYDNRNSFPYGNDHATFASGPQHPPLDMEMLQS